MAKYITTDSDGAITGMYDDGVRPPPPAAVKISDELFAKCGSNVAFVNGVLVPYSPPPKALTIQQQASVALSKGLTITSTTVPALNGTFDVSSVSQQRIVAEVTSILLNGAFTDGSTSIQWVDLSGKNHSLTTTQFKAFASAVSSYVASVTACILGQASTLPPSVSILP
ncbi:DUF4376 domain-containing protein [Burkholderia multivorans]|uniref:DUF4376 domain-containing protein n=1 Tax=Burkholderia multivorans TaxID=87883 RepID=UPI0011B1CC15|nr:TULIP family P47-like protein [Burkholderia multivorans]MBU9525064.1 TULIP family P47-like protein [Burkholderia multivorans]MBU9536989.1 TULIP family P47-like protein [Burkholderia multivorans]MBU9635416.1 TULIP family P47-like protein [Burkholderia multivorans]